MALKTHFVDSKNVTVLYLLVRDEEHDVRFLHAGICCPRFFLISASGFLVSAVMMRREQLNKPQKQDDLKMQVLSLPVLQG